MSGEDNAPKYLKHTGNGRVFPWTPFLAARKDMVPVDSPDDADLPIRRGVKTKELASEKVEAVSDHEFRTLMEANMNISKQNENLATRLMQLQAENETLKEHVEALSRNVSDVQPTPEEIRKRVIRDAVKAIPPENYGKAGFGRDPMPKAKDVEHLSGLPNIKSDEVREAMVALGLLQVEQAVEVTPSQEEAPTSQQG